VSYTDDRIFLIECMEKAGYTREGARKWLDGFVAMVNTRALEDSDHTAYRELADRVYGVLDAESDPADWDGDDSELELLTRFVQWLPDMARHNAAGQTRNRARSYGDGETGMIARALHGAADRIDPFERTSGGQWVRKSDKTPVPWPVVKD
jgi:hypothetical protein